MQFGLRELKEGGSRFSPHRRGATGIRFGLGIFLATSIAIFGVFLASIIAITIGSMSYKGSSGFSRPNTYGSAEEDSLYVDKNSVVHYDGAPKLKSVKNG